MERGNASPARSAGFERQPSIRPRQPDDLAACIQLLAEVRATDGYPLRWPADPLTWLIPRYLLAAWVAEGEQAVLGGALRRRL